MFIGYQNGQIKYYTEEKLNKDMYMLDAEMTEVTEVYIYDEDLTVYVPKNIEWEEKQKRKENARIQELSMTRSDFFDGTIKAFGLNEQLLTPIISRVLDIVGVDNTTKLVALNNFENALNFYRKHTLFTLLANIDLPIGSNGESIRITSEQFDKFFDETDKKNPDAYKELLPPIENIGE